MSLVSAIIDSREPPHIQGLTFGGVPTVVSLLDSGDILAATDDACMLLVERKTATDFLGTLRDDRLFPQLSSMRAVTPWCYLVLCGDLRPGIASKCYCDGKDTGWNWSSVSGALLTVQELGVNVVWIGSDADFEQAVIRLGNRDRKSVKVLPPRDTSILSEGENVLVGLPGIGPEKAAALLNYCGSAASALQYLSDDHWEGPSAPGFANGTKRRVRRALGLTEDYVLAVVKRQRDETE
jgi:ERCC4-type nuclease